MIAVSRRLVAVGVGCGLLCMAAAVEAQQVCYAYDGAGRLTGVIDENEDAAFYDYDAVGNILSIRRQGPTGPVTIYAVYPLSGRPSEQFEIFGVGFSATPAENQVTVGGVPATVAATLPCTLVVDVPASGITGQVQVVTPAGEDAFEESFLVSRFAIEGTAAAVLPGIFVQFSVTSNGCNDPAVVWFVNGVAGGADATGTVTADGLYQAPPAVPTPAFVTIRAESVVCPTLFDELPLNVVTSATTFVYAAASVTFGAAPVLLPPQTVFADASVRFGAPEVVLPPGTVIDSASANNGAPVIATMSPNTRARSANSFLFVVAGVNLAGATGITFFNATVPDPLITVQNVTVNGDGTVSATVSIPLTAATGPRTVRVETPAGHSTAVRSSANTFTVTP